MRKLLVSLFFIPLLFLFRINVDASEFTVYNDLGVEFQAGDEICANRNYYIQNDGSYREVLILDQETRQILDTFNSNSSELEIAFPENAGDITIMVTPYLEDKTLDDSKRTSIDISIIPCEYEAIVDEYEFFDIPFNYSIENNILTITKKDDSLANFTIGYQFLDSVFTETYDFTDGETLTIDMSEHNLIQVVANYTDDSGNPVNLYYEIEYNQTDNNYFIRQVNQFEVMTFNKKDIINFKLLIITLMLLGLLVFISIQYTKVKKQYKLEKIKKLQEENKQERE